MGDSTLGDVPSEGNDGGRKFGVYREHTPDPKVPVISKVKVFFIAAVVAVVSFAVFFPLIQYALRGNKQSVPYNEITNIPFRNNAKASKELSSNCSTKVLLFGNDCTESSPTYTEDEGNNTTSETRNYVEMSTLGVTQIDDITKTQNEEATTDAVLSVADTREFKFLRVGRSGWLTTPYPYYNLPKPTPTTALPSADDLSFQQSNIFAIPLDMYKDNYSTYTKPNLTSVNFTPPPYAFTPFPDFSDSYAQLLPYKLNKNYTNFEKIVKFLNNNGAPDQNLLTEYPENIINSRTTTMKVSGTYIMPLDRRRPGDIVVAGSEKSEESSPYFNGHAYVSDPFVKFRPSNPAEINRLIPVRSGIDLSPRFRRPVSFVPKSSLEIEISPPLPPIQEDFETAGSHTVAIFHPPGHQPNSQRPPLSQTPTTVASKEKPLSVMLDIYPVTIEAQPDFSGSANGPSARPGRERGRLNPKWKPKSTERPRWRPQTPRRPSLLPGKTTPDNHMIVHLNLFPNKRKSYTYPRRNKTESTTPVDLTTLLSGGHYMARSGLENPHNASITEELLKSVNSTLPSTQPSNNVINTPEYSALSSPTGRAENYTTKSDNETTSDIINTSYTSSNYSTDIAENVEGNNSHVLESPAHRDQFENTTLEDVNTEETVYDENIIGSLKTSLYEDLFTTDVTITEIYDDVTNST